MSRITRIDIDRLHFTTVPGRRVAEIEAALSQQRASRRTAPSGSIDADIVARNIVDLEGELELAEANLQAHTAHLARLEAARVAERDETEKRRQAADDQMKAQAKSTFLASNRTASEDDFVTPVAGDPGPARQEKIERRLEVLERIFIPPRCITCCHWDRFLILHIDGDSNEVVSQSHPDTCPTCGRVVQSMRELRIVGYVGDG